MGAFVLGVLIGWLAEWLFYTFWVKAGDNQGDCSAIKAELELKNRQISSLQSQLVSATEKSDSNGKTKQVAAKIQENKSVKQAIPAGASKAAVNKPLPKVSEKSQSGATSKPKQSAEKSKTTKKPKVKVTGDDFTKLSGIGPSMSATLKSLGIDTFKKLADSDDDKLRELLEKSGAKMNNNKDAMDSWNEQAILADKGDFVGLKKKQQELKK